MPKFSALLKGGEVAVRQVEDLFAPRLFGNRDSLNAMMEMKGEHELHDHEAGASPESGSTSQKSNTGNSNVDRLKATGN